MSEKHLPQNLKKFIQFDHPAIYNYIYSTCAMQRHNDSQSFVRFFRIVHLLGTQGALGTPLSFCRSVHLSVCPSVCPSVRPQVCQSVCQNQQNFMCANILSNISLQIRVSSSELCQLKHNVCVCRCICHHEECVPLEPCSLLRSACSTMLKVCTTSFRSVCYHYGVQKFNFVKN